MTEHPVSVFQDFTAIDAGAVLAEGPLWCPDSQSLLWIDGNRPRYYRWRFGAPRAESWPLERPPAALARLDDGRLLMAFRARLGLLAHPGAPVADLAPPGLDLSLILGDERFNDAKVDRMGRLWIGSIDRALTRPIGHLWRIRADGMAAMAGGFALSNGMGWSPDGHTMYFAESLDRQVHRYGFDAASGSIAPAGMLANWPAGSPKPDGLTVDADGGIWCAVFGGGCVNRYLPDGRLERSLRLPVSQPTSCMFGGPDFRTLFVTTAALGLSAEQQAAEPLAGSVLAFAMDVAGLPEPTLSADCCLLRNAALPEIPKGLCHV